MIPNLSRRSFLRAVLGAGIALGTPLARATTGAGKTLVVLFQRGGCDGLNTVVPHGDDAYYALRPGIAIPPPGASAGSAIELDGLFGLHPGLAALEPHYQEGHLAILPAVHYPQAERSHFAGMDIIESAAATDPASGWLGRYLAEVPVVAALRALGFGDSVPRALRGGGVVSVFGDLAQFELDLAPEVEFALVDRLAATYAAAPNPSRALSARLHDTGRRLWGDHSLLATIDFDDYAPANGAWYPDSRLGRELRQCAQLVRAVPGLEIVAIDSPGWDTHSAQGAATGRQASLLRDLGDGIAAFVQDLGTRMDDVLLLTMTEFGRTAAENGSGGTDHGHAATWLALGGAVAGGIHLGSGWPGLGPGLLHEDRDVAHTIDFRDVFAEVLIEHLGAPDLTNLLPGHPRIPIGFL